jgi:transcriptional antiterminator NusG
MSMEISVQGLPWFAIQVRTGTEKTSTAVLQYKGYECFLPLSKSRRRWSDRIKQLDVALFPGYLFCRFDPNHRLPVLMVPGVIQVVGIGKTPIPVEDDEIAALQRVGINGLPAQPWPYSKVGKMARIEYGPLRGLTGIVFQVKSEIKLVLSVCLLQRSVAVEVDPAWLGEPHPSDPAVLAVEPGLPTGLDQNHFVPPHQDLSDRRTAAD